jgi:hypothetical protein
LRLQCGIGRTDRFALNHWIRRVFGCDLWLVPE